MTNDITRDLDSIVSKYKDAFGITNITGDDIEILLAVIKRRLVQDYKHSNEGVNSNER